MPISAEQSLDFERAREDMVERQVRTWEVFDATVLEAMKRVPREHFVPARFRTLAFADTQIPLDPDDGRSEVMMQPKVEGRLLQALGIRSGDSILEIGTGSGYLTALLAHLVQQGSGKVHSVDIRASFTAAANRALNALSLANITLETRDAAILDDAGEDYDCIVVTGSMPVLHESFRRRLKIGGRLFVVVGGEPIMEAQLHTRVTDNDWAVESLFDTAIPPLVNAWNPARFNF